MYRSLNILGYKEVRSHYPAAYRVVDINADNQVGTAADPRPRALIKIPADVHTKSSQVRAPQPQSGAPPTPPMPWYAWAGLL
jgi:hypothetical protein